MTRLTDDQLAGTRDYLSGMESERNLHDSELDPWNSFVRLAPTAAGAA